MTVRWRINPKTKDREQVEVNVGDIWQDDRAWHLATPAGWNLITTRTKARALAWRKTFIASGEDWGEDYNPILRDA